MTDYKEIASRIVEEVECFEDQMIAKTQVRHSSTQAHGSIVEHFAKSIIDAEFAHIKAENTVKDVEKVVKELKELDWSV